MNLEVIPNEVLFDLFDFFTGMELLRTFYGLNSRFNFLLHEQFQNCSFKFNSVSKRDFDKICQQHLLLMASCIITLDLVDFEDTPEQIKSFLSYNPSLNRFTQLGSFSLSNLRSYQTLLQILDECHHLYQLTQLNFFSCYFEDDQVDFQLIVNHIWSLPKLIRCTIGIGIKGECLFCTPTKTSLSLECVSIDDCFLAKRT
jgi:hypothetical protein